LAIFVLLPESLSTEARQILTKNAQLKAEAGKRRDAVEREWENETPDVIERSDPFLATPRSMGGESTWSWVSQGGNGGASKRRKRALGRVKRFSRTAFHFLEPLAIFLPREKEDGYGKDWSLTIVAGAITCLSMMMVSQGGSWEKEIVADGLIRVSFLLRLSLLSTPTDGLQLR
jgi:hypothetical protein